MAAFALHPKNQSQSDATETRDTLFLLGGISLIVFGAGLVATNPVVRKMIGNVKLGGLLSAALPDFERYMKLKAM
jgi:hypothetical protein